MLGAIGYARAKTLMTQFGWKARVTLKEDLSLDSLILFHPEQPQTYRVRRDAGAKLIKECHSCCRGETDTVAILGFDKTDE